MNIVFPYIGSESLAIEMLSSLLKEAGHNVSLAFDPGLFDDKQYIDNALLKKLFSSRRHLISDIIDSRPQLVAFSVGTDNYMWACEVAKEIKSEISAPIIFGGIHATACPSRVITNDFVDMVCVGEGEGAIVDLAEMFERGNRRSDIPNIWFKEHGKIIRNETRGLVEDLDLLPLLDKELFAPHISIRNGKYMTITSRGCPFNCSYCYNNVMRRNYKGKGKYVRQRNVEGVLNELKIMKDRYRYKNVAFMDDLFVGNKRWFSEFAPRYREEIGLPYNCMTYTSAIDTDTAYLLKVSGCSRIQFGIQTMNEYTRKNILKRSFEDTGQIRRALQICKDFDIPYSVDHIFGIPYESARDYKGTARFYIESRAERICCYALFYYPGTEITNVGRGSGAISDIDIENIERGKVKNYVYGSSLKGRDLFLHRAYRNFYSVVPLLPVWLSKFLLNTGFFISFYFLPRGIGMFFEAIIAFKSHHPRGTDYIVYYLRHMRGASRL